MLSADIVLKMGNALPVHSNEVNSVSICDLRDQENLAWRLGAVHNMHIQSSYGDPRAGIFLLSMSMPDKACLF